MRRLYSIVAMVLIAALFTPTVTAQDAASTDYAGHPFVGSWMLDTDTSDPGNTPSLVVVSADGSYIEFDSDGPGVGAWEPTGDTTATLTIHFIDSDGGGGGVIRASVEVAADGQSLTASYTLEIFDPATGEGSGEIGPGIAEGTRMVVEAPGTPEMSFEDFYAQFGGTPEAATPAS